MRTLESNGLAALISATRRLPPLMTAVVYPCDGVAIAAAVEAAAEGVLEPILIGPRAEIARAAAEAGCDISGFAQIDAIDPYAAAKAAIEEVEGGNVRAVMKGSLHTDELLGPIVQETALHTMRRMSHCYVLDLPDRDELLILTDTAVNIAPTLEEKVDIVRNAIDLARAIGIPEPRVAVLSSVEFVNPQIQSTIDAAALAKMADRGQITGALVDGPLALDDAIVPEAARLKHIVSPVAGRANVLVVPDLDAGNMLAKEFEFIAHGEAAGIVLGARIPIILTSRAETVRTRVASCALAALYLERHRVSREARGQG
jgi:phosphate acetyltransferase